MYQKLKETALHIACRKGLPKMAAKLLEFGADTHAKDFIGKTPMDTAIKHKKRRMAQLLESWEKYRFIPESYLVDY